MIGKTLEVFGELLIGYVVIRVHSRVMKEHRIDDAVLYEMRREKIVGGLGMLLIVIGYALDGFFSI